MPNMHFTKQQIDKIGRVAAHVSKLQDRCDSFIARRAKRDADKAQRKADKARRDAERLDPVEEARIASTPDAPLTKPDWLPQPRDLPAPVF
jgi:hypothetical protein